MAFAIGLEHVKTTTNVGTLLRSAYNFGAAMVFTVGRRYDRQVSDTVKAYRHLPVLHFTTWDEYRAHAPFGWTPIGVEILPNSFPLEWFVHPASAVYILGPEDGSLSQEAIRLCRVTVQIPSRLCLNLAVAGSIVMYDRVCKKPRERGAT